MSLTKREIDNIEQAEELNRGAEDRYYGEPWPSEEEMRKDAEKDGKRAELQGMCHEFRELLYLL